MNRKTLTREIITKEKGKGGEKQIAGETFSAAHPLTEQHRNRLLQTHTICFLQ